MSGPSLEELAEHKEVVQEEEPEGAVGMQEEAEKREEAAQEREAASIVREGVLKRKDEELPQRGQVVERPGKDTKRMRTSAAGSSSQPPPPGPATDILDLPDEVLAKIFALLNQHTIVKVVSVCPRWREVIEDWNRIKMLRFEEGTFTTEEALCLIDCAPGLKSLELYKCSDTLVLLDAASVRCTKLLYLSVDWFIDCGSFLFDTLQRVFQTCPHIRKLRLWYKRPSENLSFCQELGTMLPDLRKLDFSITLLSDLHLDALVSSCSRNQMEEFKAYYGHCSRETVGKIVQFWGSSLQVLVLDAVNLTGGALALLAGCSELRRLTLVGLPTRRGVLRGLAALSHLEELCVFHKNRMKREKWCRFFSRSRSSHRLRKLLLLGWSPVNDRLFASIVAFCPQLEELEVTCFMGTVSGVRELLCSCRKLHSLSFHTRNAIVVQIVTELPQLAPQLRRIHLGDDAMRSLGEDTLKLVQAQMPHLRID